MYDHDSGLLYNETIVSAVSSLSDQAWTKRAHFAIGSQKFRGLPANCEARDDYLKLVESERCKRIPPGGRSLLQTALEKAISSFDRVTADALLPLPKHLLIEMWSHMEKRELINFHAWTSLSKALAQEADIPLGVFRYQEQIKQPRLSLSDYTKPMSSATFEFLTYLSISTWFSPPSLVQLADVPNLTILEILHKSPVADATLSSVSDRVFRAWSERAESGDFSVLRILILHGHKDITDAFLRYLNSFPVLGLVELDNCSVTYHSKSAAHTLGWDVDFNRQEVLLAEDFFAKSAGQVPAGQAKRPLPHRTFSCTPLWDMSRIVQTPRVNAAASEATQQESYTSPAADLSPIVDSVVGLNWRKVAGQATDQKWREVEKSIWNAKNETTTWELKACAAHAYIGELREDEDLKMAGLSIRDRVAAVSEYSTQVISSKPLACLKLGKRITPDRGGIIFTDMHEDEEIEARREARLSGSKLYRGWHRSLDAPTPRATFISIKLPDRNKRKMQESGDGQLSGLTLCSPARLSTLQEEKRFTSQISSPDPLIKKRMLGSELAVPRRRQTGTGPRRRRHKEQTMGNLLISFGT